MANDKEKMEPVIKEVQDTMAKLQGILNVLRNAPAVVANNRLIGVYQKLGSFLQRLNEENVDSDQASSTNANENSS